MIKNPPEETTASFEDRRKVTKKASELYEKYIPHCPVLVMGIIPFPKTELEWGNIKESINRILIGGGAADYTIFLGLKRSQALELLGEH